MTCARWMIDREITRDGGHKEADGDVIGWMRASRRVLDTKLRGCGKLAE